MNTTQLIVRKLLEKASWLEWSVQGLGMLRTYLSRETRLHVWHSAFKVPNVSTIHDHPWDFESRVIVGRITNRVYGRDLSLDPSHTLARIKCGEGGGLIPGSEESLGLRLVSEETYTPGEMYDEIADVLHESVPEDGTVTIVTRRFRRDTEHARVCYPIGTSWVSAEPRPATADEIATGVKAALELPRLAFGEERRNARDQTRA